MRTEGLVDLIYTAALDPSQWVAVLEKVADAVDGELGWLSINRSLKPSDPTARIGLEWRRAYMEYYNCLNPFLLKPGLKIVTFDDIVSRSEFHRSEYHNDFLKPQGVSSCLMIPVSTSGSIRAFMNITCSFKRDRFDAGDIAVVAELQPHLIRAFALGRRLADERRAAAADQNSEHAVFVLDECGKVRRMNGAALEMVRQADDLRLVGGRLSVTSADDARRFDAVVRQALSSDETERRGGDLGLATARGPRPLSVTVSPVSPESAEPYRLGPAAVVCVTDLNRRIELSEAQLRAVFALTPAEARVAQALVDGQGARAVAERLGLSFQTVRNQMVRIYQKTGARGQADLVGMLTRMVGH